MTNYGLSVISDNPKAYWKFEEDDTLSINYGSLEDPFDLLYNNNTVFVEGIVDSEDQAYKLFNLTNQAYVEDIFNTTNGFDDKLTIEGWIFVNKKAGTRGGKKEVIWSKTPASGTTDQLIFCITDDNTLQLIDSEDSLTLTATAQIIAAEQWYHVAVVIDDTSYQIWLDGIQILDYTGSSYDTTTDTGFIIGGLAPISASPLALVENGTYTAFQGLIDEVAIFNVALGLESFQSRLNVSGRYNVDNILNTGEFRVLHRVRRFDVDWGQPLQAYTYDRAVMANNAAGYWKLSEPVSATVEPNLGGMGASFNGTISGTPSYEDDDISCLTYLDFDGSNDLVNCGAIMPSTQPHKVTIAFWIKPEDNSRTEVVIAKSKAGTPNSLDYAVYVVPDGDGNLIRLDVQEGGSVISTTSSSDELLEVGAWSHVVVSVDGEAHRVYVNGVLSNSFTDSNVLLNPRADNVFCIGGVAGGTIGGVSKNNFTGGVKDVSIQFSGISATNITKLFKTGATSSYLEDSREVDTAPIRSYSAEAERIPYWQYSQSLNPKRYYRLSDTFVSGSANVQDYAPSPINGTYADATVDNTLPSPIIANPVEKARFYKNSSFSTYRVNFNQSLQEGTALARGPITIDFWYKRRETPRNTITNTPQRTFMFGYKYGRRLWGASTSNDVGGFCLAQYDHNVELVLNYKASGSPDNGERIMPNAITVPGTDTDSQWVHIAFTVTSTGLCTSYMNGQQVAVSQIPDGLGVQYAKATVPSGALIGPSGGDPMGFSLGGQFGQYWLSLAPAGVFSADGFGIAHFSIYPTALSQTELAAKYRVGRLGNSYQNQIISSDDVATGYNTLSCNEYPELTGEEDVTELIEDNWSLDDSLDSLIGTAKISVRESFDTNTTLEKFRENTYVIFETRLITPDNVYDSGWIPLGHYLSDGVPAATINANGEKVFVIGLRSVTKLLTLDYQLKDITPDILFVSEENLSLEETATAYYKFRRPRPGFTDDPDDSRAFCYNWMPTPAPRLFAKNFTNLDENDPLDVKSNEKIPIRSSNGAVQILYGEGSVIFDKDFFDDKFVDNGIGQPNSATGISCEFYRQAGHADIDLYATVDTIAWNANNNKWSITFDNSELLDYYGKTLFVKSGDAKGKVFKIWGTKSPNVDLQRTLTSASQTGSGVNSPNNWTISSGGWLATWYGWHTSTMFSNPRTSKDFRYVALDTAHQIPTGATILGVEFIIQRMESDIKRPGSGDPAFIRAEIVENEIKMVKGGVKSGTGYTRSIWWNRVRIGIGLPTQNNDILITDILGGKDDLNGVSLSVSDINAGDWGLSISLQSKIYDSAAQTPINTFVGPGPGTNATYLTARILSVKARVTFAVDNVSYVTDYNLNSVNPTFEGLASGDIVQIGDANKIEDAIRKVLGNNGFQENNTSSPFYFELRPDFLSPIIPPIENLGLSANVKPMEVLEQLFNYGSPSFKVYYDRTGTIRSKTFIVNENSSPNHVLTTVEDESPDTSDLSVYTKYVAIGEGQNSVDIGLHATYGGNCAVRAYKLNQFATQDGGGETLVQSTANDKIAQIFDGSTNTPSVFVDNFDYLGVVYQAFGTNVRSLEMAAQKLFAVDLGTNVINGKAASFEIEEIGFLWINSYHGMSTHLPQLMRVYYMTEEDYVAEFGQSAPHTPDQTRANLPGEDPAMYFPSADAGSWKLLVEGVKLEDGENRVPFEEFVTENPVKARFLMFECEQSSYRFPIEDVSSTRYARVILPTINIWSSRRIIASAELGVTSPHDSGNLKRFANRLRRRTLVAEANPYIDTYEKGKQFAVNNLIEISQDFRPLALTCINPAIAHGDIVRYCPAYTGSTNNVASNFLVVQRSYDAQSTTTKLILVKYDLADLQ